MKKVILLSLIAGAVTSTGCITPIQDTPAGAINLANLDTTISPANDFYQYACGGWMKNNPLKPEYARFGSFDQLRNNNEEQLKGIVEKLVNTSHDINTIPWKIATFYEIGLDSTKLNKEGVSPILKDLDAIFAIKNKEELSRQVALMHKEGITPYFALYVGADEKNSATNIVQLYQAGIAMGDRDYYLINDEVSKNIRTQYSRYIKTLFSLANYTPEAVKAAEAAVMKIETGIASASYTREDLRDSQKNYNKIPIDKFKASTDPLNWDIYFSTMGLNDIKEIDAKQSIFYEDLNTFLKNATLEEQKFYLAFNLLDRAAPYLSDAFSNASFTFYGKAMSGKEEQQPRWKRSLNTVNGAMSEAIGQIYVKEFFPPQAKERMLTMVHNLQTALSERINTLSWMGDSTKIKAQEKLNAFIVKIGYPDTWRNYDTLTIEADSYWANVRRSAIFDIEYMLSDAGKPVDKERWHMSPQTVNAYYNPTTNEICFPAAILQPPFFDLYADDAVNYGAIGVVIGHEMTHGFDDQGRQYDKNGNLNDWWTTQDADRFTKLANILVKQYDDIIVADSTHANGRFTLGENIADQGGLLVAHEALQNTLKGKPTPAPIEGFTSNERFYLGYANLWAQNIRTAEILRLTKIDPHSLGKWRVNAALRNIDTFYETFHVTPTDSMYLAPAARVVIW